ncbi:MAG: dCMP deaminase family protein [Abditibacteriota bacterium]|nr:dCMP deaminase family protein [Abditibacteriota bacterium]
MDIVDIIARRSTCNRKKVGAVITMDRRILSHGYNGVLSGMPHCCDTGECLKEKMGDEDYKICVHAEQNAICQCAKRGLSVDGATIYVNANICLTCAKLIAASGIKRVVFRRDSETKNDGVRLLSSRGIEVEDWKA